MKVLAKPISVYTWTGFKGQIHPVMFRVKDKEVVKELKIDRVVRITKEKLAGNEMLVYTCQSEIKGVIRPFELKYEINTCKWILFKM